MIIPHRDTQRLVFWIILDPVEWTISINNHQQPAIFRPQHFQVEATVAVAEVPGTTEVKDATSVLLNLSDTFDPDTCI